MINCFRVSVRDEPQGVLRHEEAFVSVDRTKKPRFGSMMEAWYRSVGGGGAPRISLEDLCARERELLGLAGLARVDAGGKLLPDRHRRTAFVLRLTAWQHGRRCPLVACSRATPWASSLLPPRVSHMRGGFPWKKPNATEQDNS